MLKTTIISLVLSGLLLFMILFPLAEFHIDCPSAVVDPNGNETCFIIKDYLWTTVFIMSLGQDGDGFALTGSMDEIHHRNIIPVMTGLLLLQFIENTRLTKRKG